MYYTVLLQYYSVVQSTTPVPLCTAKYYSTSIQQSTTPILLRTTPALLPITKYYSSTTKYYSSTTSYYKVLLQYYSVLQSTTPVLLRTTKYYSSTTSYYKVLLQYYKVLLGFSNFFLLATQNWLTLLIRLTYEVSFTIRGATKSHPPTWPNTAPATQNECHQWSASHMKRHFQCAEEVKSPFKLTKYCACHEILSSRFQREIPELLPPI